MLALGNEHDWELSSDTSVVNCQLVIVQIYTYLMKHLQTITMLMSLLPENDTFWRPFACVCIVVYILTVRRLYTTNDVHNHSFHSFLFVHVTYDVVNATWNKVNIIFFQMAAKMHYHSS